MAWNLQQSCLSVSSWPTLSGGGVTLCPDLAEQRRHTLFVCGPLAPAPASQPASRLHRHCVGATQTQECKHSGVQLREAGYVMGQVSQKKIITS